MSRKFEYSTLWNWNGHMVCSVDIETTGDIPERHDIIQVCVLPLDSNFQVNKQYTPFYMDIKPTRHKQYIDDCTRMNRQRIAQALIHGMEKDRAADHLTEWFETKLKLAPNKRILPLACYWPHDRGFLINWLGWLNFHHIFDVRYRDVQALASSLNDKSEFTLEKQIPYPKVNLQYLCSQLHIERANPHDCMDDAVVTAQVYAAMMKNFF